MMDEPARRRSLRTRTRKSTNDSDDDSEPERKKFATSQKSELVGKKSSERDEKYPETDESSTSPEPACTIQQLPPEVLAVIFSYLTSTRINSSRSNFRLVCKDWCDVYVQNTDAKVFFERSVPSVHFGNCGFRKLRIRFIDVDLDKLPPSMWEKIGCKVHTLILESCKVGDQGLKNIILNCCNLRSLRVLLNDNKDSGDLFCSPNMLTELPITQTNLESFQIINMYPKTSVYVPHWIKTFKAFFKVFPNVTHYTAGYRCSDGKKQFRFRFLKELDENDVNKIATSLALSLSTLGSHTRQALDTASSLGIVDMSIKFPKYFCDNKEATLIKFFNNYHNLKFLKVNLASNLSVHMLKTIFLQILQHCPNLRKLLYYCTSRTDDAFGRWLGHNNISEIEFVKLRTMCPNLEELSVNDFKLQISHSGLSYIEYSRWQWLERSLEDIVKTYPNLQVLNLEHTSCTDKTFQSIFKHLYNLKGLLLKLTYMNTNEGITGRRSNFPGFRTATVSISSSGYSLNNLKNLEELELIGFCNSQLSDDIFYEFELPKLRYFRVDRPKDPLKVLPIMGRSMPLLETICFMSLGSFYDAHNDPWTQSLVPFCQHMKKLFTMVLPHTTIGVRYPDTGRTMVVNNVLNVFKACSSLRFIEGYKRTCARYLPDTQELIVTDDNNELRNFSINND